MPYEETLGAWLARTRLPLLAQEGLLLLKPPFALPRPSPPALTRHVRPRGAGRPLLPQPSWPALCLLPPWVETLGVGLIGVSSISQKPVHSAPGPLNLVAGGEVRPAVLSDLGEAKRPTSASWRAELAPLISASQGCGPGRHVACPWARAQQATAASVHLKRTVVCVSRNWHRS